MPMTPTERPDQPPKAAPARWLDALETLCVVFSGVLLVTLITLFGWLVFGRYVLNDTPTWVEQAALVLVVWITFLGAAAGVRRRSHLSIEFLREGLPRAPRLVLRAAAAMGMLAFGVAMAWQGWEVMTSTWGRAIPMLGASEGFRAMPMMICGGLIVVFTLAELAAVLRGHDSGGR